MDEIQKLQAQIDVLNGRMTGMLTMFFALYRSMPQQAEIQQELLAFRHNQEAAMLGSNLSDTEIQATADFLDGVLQLLAGRSSAA